MVWYGVVARKATSYDGTGEFCIDGLVCTRWRQGRRVMGLICLSARSGTSRRLRGAIEVDVLSGRCGRICYRGLARSLLKWLASSDDAEAYVNTFVLDIR